VAGVPITEFRIADRNAVYRGVSLDRLMDGAGRAVAAHVTGMRPVPRRVLIVCGKGNNGGDGLTAAVHLPPTMHVTVLMAEGKGAMDRDGPAWRALRAARKARSVRRFVWSKETAPRARREVAQADVVVDCLLGSGIRGPARAPYNALVDLVNHAGGHIVSVDVPSGFPFEPAVRPRTTLTIESPKEGMTRANSGRIVPIRIGFPPEAWSHTGPGELTLIPPVAPHAHKEDRGVLAVVAGGPYSGAPALAALSAYAFGAGLVHVFTPQSVSDVVRRFDPTLVVHPLPGDHLAPEHVGDIVRAIEARRCRALAIGPGLGRAASTLEAVRRVVSGRKLPTVIDADAIHAVSGFGPRSLRHAVVTPHAGEFKAFSGVTAGPATDDRARRKAAEAVARKRGTTVLLKGRLTVITDGKRTKLNDAGSPGMAVGGSGDVLTGAIGALLSKGLSPFDAARTAAFACGKAGELAFEDRGHSMVPPDMVRAVPRVMSRYLDWWGGKP
jgi:NAD(P)H-hydrate epimerase